jgi:hypothetical protein
LLIAAMLLLFAATKAICRKSWLDGWWMIGDQLSRLGRYFL